MDYMGAVKGSVYQIKDGRWIASYKQEGKKKCIYGKTKDEAISKRDEFFNGINQAIGNSQPCLFENEATFDSEHHSLDSEIQSISSREVVFVNVNKLIPFNGHPFRLYEGERLDDMVASIKSNGILVPIIVRRKAAALEILAGHNRVNAAKIAVIDEIPTIILGNVSDEDAMAYVVETNLIQRSFADMVHSEKAAVIALHHSKMFSQGKRNDIIKRLKSLDNQHEYKENATYSQFAKKLTSIEKVGESYDLSKDKVARYLRINKLIPSLKLLLDNGGIPFISAVTLSYINESEQKLVSECINQNGFTVNIKKATEIRQFSRDGKLNKENIYQILSGKIKSNLKHATTFKFKKGVYEKYFKPDQSTKEVQEIMEKALEMYFAHK